MTDHVPHIVIVGGGFGGLAAAKALTDAHASAFQTVSADDHPIHYDVEYARRHGHSAHCHRSHGSPVARSQAAHGTWIVDGKSVTGIPAAGTKLGHSSCVLLQLTTVSAHVRQQRRSGALLASLDAGDELMKKTDDIVTTRATVHNQRGEIVLDGEHTYSLKAASGDKKVTSPGQPHGHRLR